MFVWQESQATWIDMPALNRFWNCERRPSLFTLHSNHCHASPTCLTKGRGQASPDQARSGQTDDGPFLLPEDASYLRRIWQVDNIKRSSKVYYNNINSFSSSFPRWLQSLKNFIPQTSQSLDSHKNFLHQNCNCSHVCARVRVDVVVMGSWCRWYGHL